MKRILSILLALVLIFSMAACAPKDTNPPEEPDNGGENQQTPDENGGNEGGEEDNTPTPEQLLEQQKEALKQQLLEEINSDAGIMNLSGSLESPTALITALERDFSFVGKCAPSRAVVNDGREFASRISSGKGSDNVGNTSLIARRTSLSICFEESPAV